MVDHVFPQDGDYDEAASFAQWGDHASFTDYVENGMSITPDHANDDFDVTAGKAFISHPSEVGAKSGETRNDVSYSVYADARTNIAAATTSGVNYIWLDVRLDDDDLVEITPTTSDSPPSHGSGDWEALKIGEIDFGSQGVEPNELNRGIEATVDSIEGGSSDTIDSNSTSFENVGHDDVDVPTTQSLIIDNFEGGVLSDEYEKNPADFEVQNSIVADGNYALKAAPGSTGASAVAARAPVEGSPKPGDEFSFKTYLTDVDDIAFFYWAMEGPRAQDDKGYNVIIEANSNSFAIRKDDGGATLDEDVDANIQPHLNEWLTCTVSWSKEGEITATLKLSDGDVLSTIQGSDTDYLRSGMFQWRVQNRVSNPTIYFDSGSISRRDGEYVTDTGAGTTELGNEVSPTGSINAGALESPLNAVRGEYARAPVNNDISSVTDSKLTLLSSGANPSLYLERVLDANGGAYGNRVQAGLGRIARYNSLLSWDYKSFSQTDYTLNQTGSVHSSSITGNPPRLSLNFDGTATGDSGGVVSNGVVSTSSIDSFRVTFFDVSYTDSAEDNRAFIALSTEDGTTNVDVNGSGIFLLENSSGNTDKFGVVEGGTTSASSLNSGDIDWSSNHDITFEYDNELKTGRVYIDGVLEGEEDSNLTGLLNVLVEIQANATTAETLEAEEVVLSPHSGVLN